jgi:hypothetical protein
LSLSFRWSFVFFMFMAKYAWLFIFFMCHLSRIPKYFLKLSLSGLAKIKLFLSKFVKKENLSKLPLLSMGHPKRILAERYIWSRIYCSEYFDYKEYPLIKLCSNCLHSWLYFLVFLSWLYTPAGRRSVNLYARIVASLKS